jgi:hypothetical protein
MKWIAALLCPLVLLVNVDGRTISDPRPQKLSDTQWFDVNNCECPITNYGEFGYMYGFWPKGSGEPYIFGAGVWLGAIKAGQPMVSCGYHTVGAGNDFMPGPPEHNSDHSGNLMSHPEDHIYKSDSLEDYESWPLRDTLGEPIVLSHLDMWCEYNDMWADQHAWEPGTKPLGLHVRQLVFGWTTKLYEDMFFILYEFENAGEKPIKEMYVGHASDMDVGWADDDLVGCDIPRSLGYTYTVNLEPGWTAKPPYYVGVRFLQGPKADDTIYVADGPWNPDYPDAYIDTVYPGERIPLTAFTRCTRGYDADTEEKKYLMLSGYNIDTFERDPWQGVTDEVPDDKRMVMGCGPFEMTPGEIDTCLIAVMFSNGDKGGLPYLQSQGDAALQAYNAGWVVPSPPTAPTLSAIPGDGQVTLLWSNAPEYEIDPFAKVMKETGDTIYKEYDFEGYRLWKSRTGLPDDWEELGQWDIANNITLLPDDMWMRGELDTAGFNVSGEQSNNAGLNYSYVDTNVINGITYFYGVTAYDYNTRGSLPNESDIWISLESGKKTLTCTPRSDPGDFVAPEVEAPVSISGNTNSISALGVTIEGATGVTGDTYELFWNRIQEGADGLPSYTYNVRKKGSTETFSPLPLRVSMSADVEGTETRTDARVDTAQLAVTEDTMYLKVTTVYDTIVTDSTWFWAGEFSFPFDFMRVHGEIVVDTLFTHLARRDSVIDSLHVTKNLYGAWADTTLALRTHNYTTYEDDTVHCLQLPDSIRVLSGDFAGNLTVRRFFPNPAQVWAHHGGADIEIHWEADGDSLLTMHVFDELTMAEIPYDSAFGDNWCFGAGANPGPQFLKPTQSPLYRAAFYICGVQYQYDGGAPFAWADRPQSGDVWEIYSAATSIPPIAGNMYEIVTEKFSFAEESELDEIRVVPNPYLVRADWDRSTNTRKIQFIHLPSECTVRIYNLVGELVRIVEHDAGEDAEEGGSAEWNLLTEDDQIPASGIYIYHVSTPDGQEKIGKFAIIR